MSNGVSMLKRRSEYTPDNKQKEVRDSLLKKVFWEIGRLHMKYTAFEKLEIIMTMGIAKGERS